jgi:hypothetical protein
MQQFSVSGAIAGLAEEFRRVADAQNLPIF